MEKQKWASEVWDLERLTLAAFYYHPDLDVARAQWKTSLGGVDNARTRPNPLFQGQGRYSLNPAPGVSPWYLQLFSGFVIETAGKRRHRINQAKALSEASHARIGQVAWIVRSRLRNSLVSYVSAIKRAEILQALQNDQENALNGIQRRVSVGEASALERMPLQLLLAQSQLQLQEADRQQQESLALVAQAVGVPVHSLNAVPLATGWFEELPPLSDGSRVALHREALLGRPDVLALMQEYQASHEALKLAVSQRYPDIRIGPGFLWNQGQRFWALPLETNFPTYLSTAGAIKEALARRREAATRVASLQAQIIAEVDRGLAAYQGALRKLVEADALLAQQERRQGMIQKQLAVGEVDRLALLLADGEKQTARLNHLDAVTQAQQALGLLEDAIQRPLMSVRFPTDTLQSMPRLEAASP